MNDSELKRERLKEHQYNIPNRLKCLAKEYPNITWNDAVNLYKQCVNETLEKFEIEILHDGFGAYLYAEHLFKERLARYKENELLERLESLRIDAGNVYAENEIRKALKDKYE